MSLNIKNKEAHKLAQQLAKCTGENMTEAVTEAVRERLERVRRERAVPLSDRLMEIGKDCAAHLKEPFRSLDHGHLLYDEKGLPQLFSILRQSSPYFAMNLRLLLLRRPPRKPTIGAFPRSTMSKR